MLLSNGLIVDGSGRPPFIGDVIVEGEHIAAAPGAPHPPSETIDCSGLAIAPGFIDLHSHADVQVLERRMEKVKQGVTTEVVGNCGFSPFPHSGDPQLLHEFGDGILGRSADWGWQSASGYLDEIQKRGANVHVAPLAGHGSLRVAVVGMRQAPLSAAELDRMSGLLEDALDAGCAGFSTGLMYAPGSSAQRDELVRLCSVVAKKDKLYATHMRSYSRGLLDAIREQIDLARASGCRLQISHLQAAGRDNWHLQRQALDEIEAARASGVDIEFDIYPYQCGSTVLTQWLPQWALDGGTDALMARLADPGERAKMLAGIGQSGRPLWEDVTISSVPSPGNQWMVGKTMADIARARNQDPFEAVFDLLSEEHAAVNVVSFNQSEDNLRQLLSHPLCSVISDGFYVKGRPHPRLHGTFPELLGSVVRERRWMSLEEAVHKITAKPAARLKDTERGSLTPGSIADITLFDPARVASRATYESPEVDPLGIVKVIRRGRVVYEAA